MGVLLHIFALNVCPVRAQNAASAQPHDDVEISVSVWDEDFRLVSGLRSENFEIAEGKKRYSVISASPKTGPMTIGLVVDMSASMREIADEEPGYLRRKSRNWIPAISSSLRSFVESGESGTEYFVVTSGQESVVSLRHTTDRDAVDKYLRELSELNAGGYKGMIDGLELAFYLMGVAKNERRALIVVSDTVDSELRSKKREKLRDLSRTAKVPIYIIFTPSANSGIRPDPQNVKLISSFTDEGGIFIRTDSPSMVTKAFEFLAKEFKDQYQIRFRAEKSAKTPRWRAFNVVVDTSSIKPSPRGRVSIRAPKKFFL